MQYSIVNTGTEQFITVFAPDIGAKVAHSDHPAFDRIVQGAIAGEDITDLFDIESEVASRFARLSERVTVTNGNVFFDGNVVDNSLTQQIMRFLEEDEDFQPLVNFFENIEANPSEHSREQLFDWLKAHDLTITRDGLILGYKGVVKSDEEGMFYSCSSGKAIVDDEVKVGVIPNYEGAVVEMPRNEVAFDPGAACSTGLHVGNYNYAADFGDTLIKVHVNPRDVVSVPTDGGGNKVRVCRYVVAGVAENQPERRPVIDDYFFDDDEGYCECCAEEEGECICTSDCLVDDEFAA